MIKTIMMILYQYPALINMLIMIIMTIPNKMNKFHPMTLMIILTTITLMISFKMNMIYYTWISFMMFLSLIGGLMIIFMYITSLTNNEMFQINMNIIMINSSKILPLMLIYLIMYFNYNKFFNIQDLWINKLMLMNDQMNISIMFKEMNNKTSYFIMLYLYFTMICIMNICFKTNNPLRQLMN